jgi:hypothetical protein
MSTKRKMTPSYAKSSRNVQKAAVEAGEDG